VIHIPETRFDLQVMAMMGVVFFLNRETSSNFLETIEFTTPIIAMTCKSKRVSGIWITTL
jgi:hypothetical protein